MQDLQKSTNSEDWYYLEVSFATPEGTKSEWLEIIAALKNKRTHRAGSRVSVTIYDDGRCKFYSPRNCNDFDDVVRMNPDEINKWIENAEKLLLGDKKNV